MVSYWKTKESVKAKVTLDPRGHYVMLMQGEKYPFPGFPRGQILFGGLSKLKHNIKNLFFNDSWAKLEDGTSHEAIICGLKTTVLDRIGEIVEELKYDMVPSDKMVPAVKEFHRAMTVLEREIPVDKRNRFKNLKDAACFILQEDDAYRFRLQWLIGFFNPSSWATRIIKKNLPALFLRSLDYLEVGEVVGDMKERVRLVKRILALILEDKGIRSLFDRLCSEMDWNKLKLTKADKYFFRGKWFKVDLDRFEY